MASQVVSESLEVLRISSYVRGYHAYMEVWTPVQDEMLLLKREPTNVADRNAVAVFKEDQVVGHVPFNLAPSISLFLKRDINKAFAKVVGEKGLHLLVQLLSRYFLLSYSSAFLFKVIRWVYLEQ